MSEETKISQNIRWMIVEDLNPKLVDTETKKVLDTIKGVMKIKDEGDIVPNATALMELAFTKKHLTGEGKKRLVLDVMVGLVNEDPDLNDTSKKVIVGMIAHIAPKAIDIIYMVSSGVYQFGKKQTIKCCGFPSTKVLKKI